MKIILLCGLSLLYSLVVFIYLGYLTIDRSESMVNGYKKVIKNEKKMCIFILFMFLILCFTGIAVTCVYKTNTLMVNVKLLTICAILFPAAYIDYEEQIIPNKLILAGIIIRMFLWILEFFNDANVFFIVIKSDVIAGVIVVVFFIICSFLVKNGLGMGDVKLMGLMALYHGLEGIFGIIFFSLIVAFVYAASLLISKKKNRKDEVPFAPSVLIGSIAATIMTGL